MEPIRLLPQLVSEQFDVAWLESSERPTIETIMVYDGGSGGQNGGVIKIPHFTL